MPDSTINRIYNLQITGYDDALKQVNNLTSAFEAMDDAKKSLNAQLQQKIDSGDTTAITELTNKIKALEDEMANLKTKRDSAAKEQALLAKAEKDMADAYLKTQKAEESLAKTEQIRTSNAIAQEKELDRQIALEQKQTVQFSKQQQAINALEGSYALLREQRKQLETFTANGTANSTTSFNGNTINYDQAIAKIKEIKVQEQLYINQLKVEKESQASIINGLQEKITQIKIERLEMEKVVSTAQAGQPVAVRGQAINYNEAIAQIEQLKAAESQLTENLVAQGVETKSLSNNYYGLLEAQKQAINIYRNTPINSEVFQEVKIQAQEAAAQVQAFNRSLSPDGTLVGEYKTGILSAFKDLGLTDVITNQRNEISDQLGAIKKQAADLASQYKQTAAESTQALQKIDQQIKLNIEQQSQLKRQLQTVGETGSLSYLEITNSLKQTVEQQEVLSNQYKQTSLVAQESLSKVNQQLRTTIEQQQEMKNSLTTIDSALSHTGTVGSQITEGISNGFKNMKTQIGQVLFAYLGFQAVFSGLQNLYNTDIKLSDSMAQLKIYIHGTTDETNQLVDALKKIPTKTNLPDLVDIATTVAQKGVAKDQIAGVTQAFDELFTALGKDAGDPHESVLTIAKLISIFNVDHNVTADRVKELGNALFGLQSSGPVKSEYLTDYSARVGAIRSITGSTIPEILGMGAAFSQVGLSEEIAGSATSRLLQSLLANTQKWADVSGISIEKLKEVIKQNPMEALLEVAEKLKAAGSDGAIALTNLIGQLPNLSRVQTRAAFGELINNTELFRQKMASASSQLLDTASIEDAFEEKQTTFAATIQQIGKAFTTAFSNQNFVDVLNGIAKVLLGIVRIITAIPFSVIVGGIGAMSAAWLFYKGNLTATRLEQMANNDATLLGFVRLNILKTGLFGAAAAEDARNKIMQKSTNTTLVKIAAINAEIEAERSSIAALEAKSVADVEQTALIEAEITARRAHIIALEGEAAATKSAAVATESLDVAVKASPLGIILTIIALVIPAFYAFGDSIKRNTGYISDQNAALKVNRDIQGAIAEQVATDTSKTISHVNALVEVLKSHTKDTYLLKEAYDTLISISPDFEGIFDGEKVDIQKLNELYPIYIQNLKDASEAKALASIRDKYALDQANAEAAAFKAQLKANQEAADNAPINAANKKRNDIINSLPIQSYDQRVTFDQPTSDVSAKDLVQKQKAAKVAAQNSKDFDDYVTDDIKKREIRIAQLTKQLAGLKQGTDAYDKLNKELENDKSNLAVIAGIPTPSGSGNINTGGTQTLDDLKKQLIDIQKQIAALDEIKNKNATQLSQLKELRKQRSDILKEIKELGGSVKGAGNSDHLLDDFNKKDLDTVSKYSQNEIDILKNKFKQELEDQNQSQDERIKSLNNYYTLSAQGIANTKTDQIKSVDLETGTATKNAGRIKNAKVRADTLIAIEKYKTDKIKEIDQQAAISTTALDQQTFAQRESILKDTMNRQINDAESANKGIQDNPLSTPGQKAQGNVNQDQTILRAQVSFFLQMEGLQEVFNIKSKENWDKFNTNIKESQQKLNADLRAAAQSILADIDKQTNEDLDAINLKFNNQKSKILQSNLSPSDKTAAVNVVSQTQNIQAGSAQLKGQVGQVLVAQQLLDFGAITQDQYDKIYAAAVAGQQKLNDAIQAGKEKVSSFSQILNDALDKLLGFGKGSNNATELGKALAQSYGIAQEAMTSYFSLEKENIQKSNQITQQKLGIELQQAQARSQSQAESNSLDRQYQAEETAANEAAFEKEKKISLEEATINYAVAVIKTLAEYPFPFSLIPIAALTVLYELQRQTINNQQYAGGGKVQPANVGNGRITNASNIPELRNGDNILATVRTNEVILNETQQRKLGGAATFKAIGVPGFASGGKAGMERSSLINNQYISYNRIREFSNGGFTGIGGDIGDSWDMAQPPINPGSYLNTGKNNGSDSSELFSAINQLTRNISATQQQTNQRIDKLQVILDPNAVAKANNKTRKSAAIGKL